MPAYAHVYICMLKASDYCTVHVHSSIHDAGKRRVPEIDIGENVERLEPHRQSWEVHDDIIRHNIQSSGPLQLRSRVGEMCLVYCSITTGLTPQPYSAGEHNSDIASLHRFANHPSCVGALYSFLESTCRFYAEDQSHMLRVAGEI